MATAAPMSAGVAARVNGANETAASGVTQSKSRLTPVHTLKFYILVVLKLILHLTMLYVYACFAKNIYNIQNSISKSIPYHTRLDTCVKITKNFPILS